MPLYRKLSGENFELAIWRIEEELAFFESKLKLQAGETGKRLQSYACRYLLNEVLGEAADIIKEDSGKPVLRNNSTHISISHSPLFAAVMASMKVPVGIDIEMLHPKVQRVAHKFLRNDEIETIDANEIIPKLILYWSAKESLYKFYGKGGIEFKTQLLIEPFELAAEGQLSAKIVAEKHNAINLKVFYTFFENHVLSYVTGL